ncbi:hypothetical protein [Nocardioides currus]|uniref:Uncharacterized protein n=1 Tax=Nocardioides currus TaxID=2133958 RepID=A0A2R7YUD8_9ACTN|nr:hypothetical protein [Nocardioides currus]PUA80017.1 hypothetical protein C7S10_15790 [Nocardioides currus]
MSEEADRSTDETTSDLSAAPPTPRHIWTRRAGVGLLVLIVGAAGLDLLGPRTGTTTAHGGGWTLDVRYPQITRDGEPAPLDLRVTTDAAFGDTVTLRLCNEWFDHLDFQAWYPSPSAETAQPGWIVYEFDAPTNGDTLDVSLDARVAPGQLGGRDGCEISVLDHDEPAVTAGFTMWRIP